jgi:Uma2 family endonuclease
LYTGAPDLVMEVLSPSNRDDDLQVKRPVYRQSGVGEIWFVDLDNEEVLIDRKRKRKYLEEVITQGWVESRIVPGFQIEVAWLWQEPLPNRARCLQEILR